MRVSLVSDILSKTQAKRSNIDFIKQTVVDTNLFSQKNYVLKCNRDYTPFEAILWNENLAALTDRLTDYSI